MKIIVYYIILTHTILHYVLLCVTVFLFLFSLILRTGGLENQTTTTIRSTVQKMALVMDASGMIVIVNHIITGFARYQ